MLFYFNKDLGFVVYVGKEPNPDFEKCVEKGKCDKIEIDIDDVYDPEKFQFDILLNDNGEYQIRVKNKVTKEDIFQGKIEEFVQQKEDLINEALDEIATFTGAIL